eukprot:GHVO01057659.1.p1 GENE.GHVO01057659.1~~GHVO01057659.1.p1  ORF type:complete len:213 (+),score=33.07 GHVO01057659.1:90-728(+)
MTLPTVIFCLGGPGSGKGTQCERVADKFKFYHISAGDCLREEMSQADSEYGELIDQYIKDGKIVPVEITCQLLKKKMVSIGWDGGKFIIDGFPRNRNNLDGWNRVMGESVHVPFILFFDCEDDVMIKRLTKRSEHSGRTDDNIDTIKRRLQTYSGETMPIIQAFESEGRCRRIDASHTIDGVWSHVADVFTECEKKNETEKPNEENTETVAS